MNNSLSYKELLLIYGQWCLKRIRIEVVVISVAVLTSFIWNYFLKDKIGLNFGNTTDKSQLLHIALFWLAVTFLALVQLFLVLKFEKRYLYQVLRQPYPTFSIDSTNNMMSWRMLLAVISLPYIVCAVSTDLISFPVMPEPGKIIPWILSELVLTLVIQVPAEMIFGLPVLGWALKRSKNFSVLRKSGT